MSKKQLAILITAIILVVLAGGAGFWYVRGHKLTPAPQVVDNIDNQSNQDAQNSNAEADSETPEIITADVDTSNWQTYRNEEYGFEVKYPEKFIINESKVATWVTIDLFSGDERKFTISDKPQGIETAHFFDIVTINNQQYKRLINNLNYNQYIIILHDNFYIVYQFIDDNEKKIINMILNSFHYTD